MGRLGLPTPESEQRRALQDARIQIENGAFEDEVVKKLGRAGFADHEAREHIRPLIAERDAVFRRRGMRDLVIGGAFIAFGLALIAVLQWQIDEGAIWYGRGVYLGLGGSFVGGIWICGRGLSRVFLGGAGESLHGDG